MFFPPVNEGVDEVASPSSESLITIVNQQAKKDQTKQRNKQRSLAFKKCLVSWLRYFAFFKTLGEF